MGSTNQSSKSENVLQSLVQKLQDLSEIVLNVVQSSSHLSKTTTKLLEDVSKKVDDLCESKAEVDLDAIDRICQNLTGIKDCANQVKKAFEDLGKMTSDKVLEELVKKLQEKQLEKWKIFAGKLRNKIVECCGKLDEFTKKAETLDGCYTELMNQCENQTKAEQKFKKVGYGITGILAVVGAGLGLAAAFVFTGGVAAVAAVAAGYNTYSRARKLKEANSEFNNRAEEIKDCLGHLQEVCDEKSNILQEELKTLDETSNEMMNHISEQSTRQHIRLMLKKILLMDDEEALSRINEAFGTDFFENVPKKRRKKVTWQAASTSESTETSPRKQLDDEKLFAEKLLREKGLYIHRVEGPTNSSLFKALADQIYNDEDDHLQVRVQITTHMTKESYKYEPFLEVSLGKHLRRLKDPNSSGSLVEVKAAADYYERTIEIYYLDDEPQCIFTSSTKQDHQPPLRLVLDDSNRYHSIRVGRQEDSPSMVEQSVLMRSPSIPAEVDCDDVIDLNFGSLGSFRSDSDQEEEDIAMAIQLSLGLQ